MSEGPPTPRLRIEIWTPPLAERSGGNLYDGLLAAELGARGHRVRVVEFGGGRVPPSRPSPEVVLQDELLHREFLARNRTLRRLPGRPRILALVHHLQSDEPERGAAERRRLREEEGAYLRSVDGVLAPSLATAGAALRLAGREMPTAVAPPGRDRLAGETFPAPLPGPDEIRARAAGPLRAAFLANLIPRKRLLELLDAVAAVPDWTLAVAGREDMDPAYAAEARRRAAAPGLAGRVRFLGALDRERLEALLRRSCLLAVPSTHEGFGIAYLEAFAFGLPALAAASGGAPEIVTDGVTGWLIPGGAPARTAERIADRLRLLAADRGRLAAMGLRAAERRRRHPTWAESAAAAERLFRG